MLLAKGLLLFERDAEVDDAFEASLGEAPGAVSFPS
jgi:hypothetical protein